MSDSDKRPATLDEADVTARLERDLPHWRYEEGWIKRTYKTNSWKGTMLAVGAIGHLAEVAWHHPDITLSYAWFEVRLTTHISKGVTERDMALAAKIEEFMTWRPGAEEDSALEGTPSSDLRFSYMKYD